MSRTYLVEGHDEAELAARRLRALGHDVAVSPADGRSVALTIEGTASLEVEEALIAVAPSARSVGAHTK